MTVAVPEKLVFSDNADGVTTEFSYPVRFLEQQELAVIHELADGSQRRLDYGSDYTVTGAGNPTGGHVTLTFVPTEGKIIRYRDTAAKQIVDLQDAARNPAEAVEQQLDRLAMVDQDHGRRIGHVESKIDLVDEAARLAGIARDGAEAAQQAAEAAAVSAEGVLADMSERYLGALPSDEAATAAAGTPSDGQLYFSSTSAELRVWRGGAWEKAEGERGPQGPAGELVDGHLVSYFDLARTLVGDGVTNDTAAFSAALTAMAGKGISKIISSAPNKRYKIVNQVLTSPTGRLEFDMNGAAFVGEYNVANANDHTTIFSATQSGLKVTFKDTEIDGSSPGGTSGVGGNPVLLFNGVDTVNFSGCTFRRMSNRTSGPFPSVLTAPWRGQVELVSLRKTNVEDCTFHGGLGEVLEIISTATAATLVAIRRCHFSKERETSPGTFNSSSSVVAYNCAKGSVIEDCYFGQHIKSAANVFGPFVIQRCTFAGVSDSNAIDFNETGKFNIDAYVVRDCKIENVIGGYAIRGSGRNVIIENIEINRCQNGIYIETWAGTDFPNMVGVGTQRLRMMTNIWIRNIISNGNNVPDGSGGEVTNTLIKIKGASAALPAYVHISGLGVPNHPSSDVPSGGFNPEIGIDCENCYLFLEGGLYQHGTQHLIRMTGAAAFAAKDCIFQGAAVTVSWVNFNNAQLKNASFDDCYVFGSNGSAPMVAVSGSTTVSGKFYFNRSGDLSNRSLGSHTVVTT